MGHPGHEQTKAASATHNQLTPLTPTAREDLPLSKHYDRTFPKSTPTPEPDGQSALRYKAALLEAVQGVFQPWSLCNPCLRVCDCASSASLYIAGLQGMRLCVDMPWVCPYEANGGCDRTLEGSPPSCNTGVNPAEHEQLFFRFESVDNGRK